MAENSRQNDRKAYAPERKNLDESFPLRGACRCAECNNQLTACWSKGRTKHYPYYYCVAKDCDANSTMIRRENIEGEFKALLKQLKPSRSLFKLISALVKKWWEFRQKHVNYYENTLKNEQTMLSSQMEQVMDRLIAADSPALIDAYESRIKKLETKKQILAEKTTKSARSVRGFEASLRTVLKFISNPCILWDTGLLENRHAVLKLAFPKGLQYCKNKGLRTAEKPLIFKVLDGVKNCEIKMAVREAVICII